MNRTGNLLIQQNEFPTNFIGSFKELRGAGELFDVTLACEDQTVEAHKVIISACSPFFRQVLTKTKQNHPFIYLKGVLHKDLLAMMDFIYTGETQVPAEDVNRFIDAAQELKINGLADDGMDSVMGNLSYDEEMKTEQSEEEMMDLINEVGCEASLLGYSSAPEEESSISELKLEISKKAEKFEDESGSTLWKCKDCGKVCKRKDKLDSHIETHLAGFSHPCSLCDKEFKTRDYLRNHIYIMHTKKTEPEKVDSDVFPTHAKEQKGNLQMEISKRIEKVTDGENGSIWKCTVCGKQMKKKDKLASHVETHLEGFTHRCVHCAKEHKTRGALAAHISIYHRGVKKMNEQS